MPPTESIRSQTTSEHHKSDAGKQIVFDLEKTSERLFRDTYQSYEPSLKTRTNPDVLLPKDNLNDVVSLAKNEQNSNTALSRDLPPISTANESKNFERNAGRIHTALVELAAGSGNRSSVQSERDIRDTMRTLTHEQLLQVDKTYRGMFGQSIDAAVQNNSGLSKDSKFVISIYSKGSDKITEPDAMELLTRASQSKNLTLLSEAARAATPEARMQWFKSGGERALKESFSPRELSHAQDFIKDGRLSFLSQLKDNTGIVRATTNDAGIDLAIDRISSEERKQFVRGMQLSQGELSGVSRQDLESKWFFQDVRNALRAAGNETRATNWENKIVHGNSSLTDLTVNQRGTLWNGSRADLSSLVENMNENDWLKFRDPTQSPSRRENFLTLLKTLKDKEDVYALTQLFDRKVGSKTFAQSQYDGRRDILDALDSSTHLIGNDRTQALDALTHMRPDEQKRYRDEKQFRAQVDETVAPALRNFSTGADAATRAIDAILKGYYPPDDIITGLQKNRLAAIVLNDTEAAMKDLERELRKNPQLRAKTAPISL